jgi:hypothetical protein
MAIPNWIANVFLTKLTNILFGLKLTDIERFYKVFRGNTIKPTKPRANRFTFEPEVTALVAKKKVAIKEPPISYEDRTAKEGKKIKAKDFIYAVLILPWHKIRR